MRNSSDSHPCQCVHVSVCSVNGRYVIAYVESVCLDIQYMQGVCREANYGSLCVIKPVKWWNRRNSLTSLTLSGWITVMHERRPTHFLCVCVCVLLSFLLLLHNQRYRIFNYCFYALGFKEGEERIDIHTYFMFGA